MATIDDRIKLKRKETKIHFENYSFLPSFDFDFDRLDDQIYHWANDIAINFEDDRYEEIMNELTNIAYSQVERTEDYQNYISTLKNNNDEINDSNINSIQTKKFVCGKNNPKFAKIEKNQVIKFKDFAIKAVFLEDDLSISKTGLGTSGKTIMKFFEYGMSCCPLEGGYHLHKTVLNINGRIESIDSANNNHIELCSWDFDRPSYIGRLIMLRKGFIVDHNFNPISLIEFIGYLKEIFNCDEATVINILLTSAFFTKTDPYGFKKKDGYLVIWKKL